MDAFPPDMHSQCCSHQCIAVILGVARVGEGFAEGLPSQPLC